MITKYTTEELQQAMTDFGAEKAYEEYQSKVEEQRLKASCHNGKA